MNNKILVQFFLLVLTTSCVNSSLQPEVVSRADAQKQQYVIFGVINDITKVIIEGNREGGAIAGAAIGGSIGMNSTDSEPEEDIATVLGAIVGSAIGSEIASSASRKDGVELLIETTSGNFVSIIQEVGAYSFFKGQNVRIIKRNGKSRVIPFE